VHLGIRTILVAEYRLQAADLDRLERDDGMEARIGGRDTCCRSPISMNVPKFPNKFTLRTASEATSAIGADYSSRTSSTDALTWAV
jgi:hypothetical protein